MAQILAEEAAQLRAARREDARLRAWRSHSAASDLLLSQQDERNKLSDPFSHKSLRLLVKTHLHPNSALFQSIQSNEERVHDTSAI
ncbi:hypothetical protein NPIL_591141 [Nephila pilipes]|uniref:Uncharacterized protein n=1 Tax=Nephila pilipes TaxID=299642 RepID=A0A8X6QU67_NEPPI|nr:hypothetical protein NPIL_591141 [Nephila pilipes]